MRRRVYQYGTLYEAVRAVVRIWADGSQEKRTWPPTIGLPHLNTAQIVKYLWAMKSQLDFSIKGREDLEHRVPIVLQRLLLDSEVDYRLGAWTPLAGEIDFLGNVVERNLQKP